MKHLLREIQSNAADSKNEISDLLRKCRILAFRLGTTEFKEWVDFELNGYPKNTELPAYRILPSQAYGAFSGPFQTVLNNIPLAASVLKPEHRDFAERVFLRDPIGLYSELVKQSASGKSLSAEWPADLTLIYEDAFIEGYGLVSAHQRISGSAIVGFLEQVRNKVLAFTLELESITPDANEADKPLRGTALEKVSQVFHTHIYGNVGNVATGASNFSQSSVLQIAAGDFGSLQKALAELGVGNEDLENLEMAVHKDADVRGRIGTNSSKWLGRMMEKAASGAWSVALSTAGAMLPKLLSAYFGIPQ